MLEAARAFKRSLPDPWQRPVTEIVRRGYAVRAFVLSLPERWRRLYTKLRGLRIHMSQRIPKWHYLEWLSSDQVPASPFLRRHRLPFHIFVALLVFSRKFGFFVYIPPSQRVKARAIRSHARKYGTRVFVETGTFRGETVSAVAASFDRCITIELSRSHWRDAQVTLRRLLHVECVYGDSGIELGRIVKDINQPALFWLDAHASGDGTAESGRGPIFDELRTIFASRLPHVILIDDARGHFVNAIRNATPSSFAFAVRNDIIRITPTGGNI